MLNSICSKFINDNNINLNGLDSNLSYIYNPNQVRKIADEYGIYCEEKFKNISIADILGYSKYDSNPSNIIESLSSYFDNNGSGYKSRSISMLDYNVNNIIDGLTLSFNKEPIKVFELDKNKYVISENGLHRYTLLRIFYLNELAKNPYDIEYVKNINKEFTIPVLSQKLDLPKTFSNAILSNYLGNEDDLYISSDIDDNFHKTGKSRVIINDDKRILNDSELIVFVRNFILKKGIDNFDIEKLSIYFDGDKDFRNFDIRNFPEIYTVIISSEKEFIL